MTSFENSNANLSANSDILYFKRRITKCSERFSKQVHIIC